LWWPLYRFTFIEFSRRLSQNTLPKEVRAEIHWYLLHRGSLNFFNGKI
jgi:hypothetical protein